MGTLPSIKSLACSQDQPSVGTAFPGHSDWFRGGDLAKFAFTMSHGKDFFSTDSEPRIIEDGDLLTLSYHLKVSLPDIKPAQ